MLEQEPLYPRPGTETVLNLPGYYKGYYCNHCPDTGTPYVFIPAKDWKVISCSNAGHSTHGCSYRHAVVLIEVKYTGLPIEPETPEDKKDKDKRILLVAAVIALIWLMR